ncbi:hypothetical protein BYT27DRAFT_7180543 [Phlegmacium glaucopus]|nr:hypothetical protein BYT27DRAFT_7180543 [Phlegmacium glaucopus]
MASAEQISLNAPHAPHKNAIDAFNIVLPRIKSEILSSRHQWNKHEPRMWSRAAHVSDADLTSFSIEDDLVEIRSAATSYGVLIFGKIRLPAINDEKGEGFVHVRIHDPPNRGSEDVRFHSIFTEEIRPDEENPPTGYCAIQTLDKPLEFFNE